MLEGLEDEKWGQVPIAFIVPIEEVTEQQLLAYCRDYLASYKIPREIVFCKELPRNGANKLLRRELKKES